MRCRWSRVAGSAASGRWSGRVSGLVRGVHGRFHGRAVFAERVGPVPFLGFVQVEGHFLVSAGLPGGEVAASRGLGLGFGCRFAFIGGGFRMSLHGRGGSDGGCGVRVLGAFDLADGAGLVSRGPVVRVRGLATACWTIL